MSSKRIDVRRDPFVTLSLLAQAGFAIGAVAIFALPGFLSWQSLNGWQMAVTVGVALVCVVILFRLWFRLTRSIVLLDEFIAFKSVFGLPRVYSYSEIVEMRAIKRIQSTMWRESTAFEEAVSIMFADGRIVAIPTGNMQVEEIRSFLEQKTGRKFDAIIEA